MALTPSDEQQLLRDAARSFLEDNSPVSRMRELRDERDATGFSRELWKAMADLGWLGIQFAEEHGGSASARGLGDVAIIMAECGRVLAPEPLLSTVMLSATALRLSANEPLQTEILPAVAAGERLIAFAFEETGRFDPYAVDTAAVPAEGGYSITGEKRYVLDGHTADQFVVVARTSGSRGDRDGLLLLLVDAAAEGVAVQRTTMVDGRNAARVVFDGAPVGAARVLGDAGLLDDVLDQATLGLAAEMVGMADE
ncbi:MAG: acyl-CoA dehydrogenase family protein, partial [Actinomycetota bacterium]